MSTAKKDFKYIVVAYHVNENDDTDYCWLYDYREAEKKVSAYKEAGVEHVTLKTVNGFACGVIRDVIDAYVEQGYFDGMVIDKVMEKLWEMKDTSDVLQHLTDDDRLNAKAYMEDALWVRKCKDAADADANASGSGDYVNVSITGSNAAMVKEMIDHIRKQS